jgi:hypothetical protein
VLLISASRGRDAFEDGLDAPKILNEGTALQRR